MHEPEPEIVFDERRWEKIETYGEGYSPRTGHTVVSYGPSLYVFGGTDRRRRQQDLFQYDIESSEWSILPTIGSLPPRRSGALGVVHKAKMFLFGGYDGRDGNYFNDLYYFNFENRSWNQMPSREHERPEARTDHIVILFDSGIYVFGGYDGHTRYNNMYRYDLNSMKWKFLVMRGQVPSRRFGHSGVVHESSKQLVVFGGWDGKDTLNDLHTYQFETNDWLRMKTKGTAPPHRYRHTAVVFGDSMFVFGGVNKQHCRYNDLQRLDLLTYTWSQVCTTGFIPSSRTFHRAVVVGNLMYLLGGYDGTDRLHDLYSIHVGTLSPSTLLTLCTNYTRNNYKTIAKYTKFDGIPTGIIDWAIWRRDSDNTLRGACRKCPKERCSVFEVSRRSRDSEKQSQHNHQTFGCNFFNQSPTRCVCGHPNASHEIIREKTLYKSKRRLITKL